MIRLIIFDAGNVLYTVSEKKFDRVVKKFLSKHKIKFSQKIGEEWDKRAHLVNRGKITLKKARELWLEGIGLSKRLEPEWKMWDIKYLQSHLIKERGVKETLEKLKKQKYKLAVLSDCPHDKRLKKMILRNIGVDHFFDEIFTSYDIGFMKPEKEAYLIVLNHFKVKPEESIFVSDHVDEIEGARKVGIKTVFFNKRKCGKADFCIRKFPQILAILKRLDKKPI